MRLSIVALVFVAFGGFQVSPALAQMGGIVGGITAQQAPARDVRKPRVGTGRIAGRVVNADGGPVRRAIVRISPVGGDPISQPGLLTDADGNFQFTKLPSGGYQIFASKSGYLDARYGADAGETGLGLGKTIKLGEDEAVTGVTLLLARGGAIGGRVLDEFGEPTPNVYVQVWRRQSVRGVRRLQPAGMSTGGTDDLGRYRVFGLQPGTYYVSAIPRNEMGPNVETPDHSGYAPTYYPGTPSASDAQPVVIAAGQDASAVDFVLSVARLARISGAVTSSTGRPVRNAYVSATLIDNERMSVSGGGGAQVQPDGTFTVNNLPPGEYLLTVRIAGGGPGQVVTSSGPAAAPQMEMGITRVSLAGGDVTGVLVQTSLGSTLSGQVVYEGNAPRGSGTFSITAVAADPFDPAMQVGGMNSGGQVQPDGSFTLRGLFGDRVLRVGAPNGWMLKSIFAGGRDVTDSPLSFDGREQLPGVQVVLTDRVTHVSGAITDDRGDPVDMAVVLVVPTDLAKATSPISRYVRTAMARDGSPWKADALPPGDYFAIALKSPQGLDVLDPEVQERIRKTGVRFSVHEGETKDVPIKLSKSES